VRTGSGDEALDAINVTVFNERHGTSSTTIGLPK